MRTEQQNCKKPLCPPPVPPPRQAQLPRGTLSTPCSSQAFPTLKELFLPTAPAASTDFALLGGGFALLRVCAEPFLWGRTSTCPGMGWHGMPWNGMGWQGCGTDSSELPQHH